MPIHVYDADSGHCLLTGLRPGKTPDGTEVRGHVRRLVNRIRLHWPKTRVTVRGDSHYGRWEAMEWCERNNVRYVFGLAQNKAVDRLVQEEVEAVSLRWESKPCRRRARLRRGHLRRVIVVRPPPGRGSDRGHVYRVSTRAMW